jgi:hypothetical protein
MTLSDNRQVIVIGDSISTNSLGRVISLAMTADVVAKVSVLAVDDGKIWTGAKQFRMPVTSFKPRKWRETLEQVLLNSRGTETVFWFSKCCHPVDKMVRWLATTHPGVRVIVDFDDDDISIMKTFKADSISNYIKMPFFRRKSPWRVKSSQRRAAKAAHALTFSNPALELSYRATLDVPTKASALIPHSRRADDTAPATLLTKKYLFGFPGTMRSHKGLEDIVRLLRERPEAQLLTFEQNWSPPAEVRDQCILVPADTPLRDIYSQIDYLLLPMDSKNPASLLQLPAKLADAALYGTVVLATPTKPIDFFAHGAYVPIEDWSDPKKIYAEIEITDAQELSKGMRAVYSRWFSDKATGAAFSEIAFDRG